MSHIRLALEYKRAEGTIACMHPPRGLGLISEFAIRTTDVLAVKWEFSVLFFFFLQEAPHEHERYLHKL